EPFEYTEEENEEDTSERVGWDHEIVDAAGVAFDSLFGLEEEAPDDPEDLPKEAPSQLYRAVGNKHVKCAVHRLNSSLKDGIGKDADLLELRSRINRLRDPLLAVCNQFNYPLISQADFDMIDVLLSIINAFRGFMLKLQQQSIPTILLVLPGVDGLIRLLETLKTEEKLPGVCQALIDSMEKRFSDVLKSGEQAGNPVYLDAAVLDPIVQKRDGYLDDNFALALSAIRAVVENLPPTEADVAEERSPYGFDLPPKRARVAVGSQKGKLKTELIEYRSLIESEAASDSLEFWSQHKQQFSLLSTIAFNVLAIPGAPTAVESLFSHMSRHSTGQKSSSGAYTIIRRTLLTFNEKFISL
ncbi:hypothetical protein AAVH_21688, partial [Aphelenchoides avenae]